MSEDVPAYGSAEGRYRAGQRSALMSGAQDVDDTRGLRAMAAMAQTEWLQESAKIRADHKKLQREVVKMHLAGSKPDRNRGPFWYRSG
jgi:hypothetical protein